MSVSIGKGWYISEMETEVTCPVCEKEFDASVKMDKATCPVFRMKCPACRTVLGISMPIFGGVTTCFEWDVFDDKIRLVRKSKFKVNGE